MHGVQLSTKARNTATYNTSDIKTPVITKCTNNSSSVLTISSFNNIHSTDQTNKANEIVAAESAADEQMDFLLWRMLEHNFGTDVRKLRETQLFLKTNRINIAYENSLGQCTQGHSCKKKAKEELERVIIDSHLAARI